MSENVDSGGLSHAFFVSPLKGWKTCKPQSPQKVEVTRALRHDSTMQSSVQNELARWVGVILYGWNLTLQTELGWRSLPTATLLTLQRCATLLLRFSMVTSRRPGRGSRR